MEYLKKFYPYTVDQFDEFHRKAFPNTSKSTCYCFYQSLKNFDVGNFLNWGYYSIGHKRTP